MTAAMPSKIDLMYEILYNPDFVPIPSPKVNVKATTVDGKPSYFMKNHVTGVYYDLDELTNYIWNLTDGKRTVSQIMQEVHREKPRVKEKTATEMLLFFADSSLLVASFEQPPKKRLRVASAFEIDLTLIEHSNNFLQSIHAKVLAFSQEIFIVGDLGFCHRRCFPVLTSVRVDLRREIELSDHGFLCRGFFLLLFCGSRPSHCNS